MEHVETLTEKELLKVRFARGTYPPKGRMYYITDVPKEVNIRQAIIRGIRKTAKDMLTIPIPMFGVKGIHFLANRLRKWPAKYGQKEAALNLSQVIRMLEEIGTGGAGFRFIFAAFLQESAAILEKPELNHLSTEMTSIGDSWREFALHAARFFKNRDNGTVTYDSLADQLAAIAEREKMVFKRLRAIEL
jgi:hypothetical protein